MRGCEQRLEFSQSGVLGATAEAFVGNTSLTALGRVSGGRREKILEGRAVTCSSRRPR